MAHSMVDRTHVVTQVHGYGDHDRIALTWLCPGCKAIHQIPVRGDWRGAAVWKWDGNLERPTLSPSILKHPTPGAQPPHGSLERCHSFVRAGVVEFLGDSTHELAGQSVPMDPALADPWRDEDAPAAS